MNISFDETMLILRELALISPSFVIFYLTTRKEKKQAQLKKLEERLEHFYIPFYQLKVLGLNRHVVWSEITAETQEHILQMLIKNIALLSTQEQTLAIKLNDAYRKNNMNQCDNLFTELSSLVDHTHSDITRMLQMPTPA